MENILYPFLGGVVIAISTSIMLVASGRITGISGIVSSSFENFNSENFWRYCFIAGLILGGIGGYYLFPEFFNYTLKFTYLEAIVAGLLVGIGTKMGSGCTSGHGVCGLPRLSIRSLTAVMTFIGFGVLTVLIRGLV